jgi:hypothetical protein
MNETDTGLRLQRLALFMAVFCILGLGALTDCPAEERLGRAERSEVIAEGTYAQYPKQFDGRGVLDAWGDQDVVVSDTKFSLAPSVSFNLPGWLNTPRDQLEPGQFVAYKLNGNGEIISLWGLERLTDLAPK